MILNHARQVHTDVGCSGITSTDLGYAKINDTTSKQFSSPSFSIHGIEPEAICWYQDRPFELTTFNQTYQEDKSMVVEVGLTNILLTNQGGKKEVSRITQIQATTAMEYQICNKEGSCLLAQS